MFCCLGWNVNLLIKKNQNYLKILNKIWISFPSFGRQGLIRAASEQFMCCSVGRKGLCGGRELEAKDTRWIFSRCGAATAEHPRCLCPWGSDRSPGRAGGSAPLKDSSTTVL